MDFQAIQNEVGAQCRFDVAVAANLTLVKRWINRAQQYIAGCHDWSWLEEREIVQTAADKTQDSPASSSVAVTSGGTTVTGTATDFATTDIGRYIQFPSTNDDWYKITARASTTSITIEAGFTGTADITGANYKIRSFYYALSSSVDRVVSVKQARTPITLSAMNPITLDRWGPFYAETGTDPRLYACWAKDAANGGNWVIQFFPWPSVKINMEVRYYAVPADLSANGDTGRIPQKLRDSLLVETAIAFGWKYLNDDRFDRQWAVVKSLLEKAVNNDGQDRGMVTVLEQVDEGPSNTGIIHYPADYPLPEG